MEYHHKGSTTTKLMWMRKQGKEEVKETQGYEFSIHFNV
jgi:hypothetical protein